MAFPEAPGSSPARSSVPWSAIVLLVIIPLTWIVYQRFFHPLASVPGPFIASLSRLWMTKHSWDGDMNITMIALHKRYGPLVRTGPNELSVADLAAIKTIYGAGTQFRKSTWYSVWQGHRKFDLFAERDEKIHGQQRRLVSRAYAMDALKDLEPHVNTAINTFLSKMDTLKHSSIDMGKWTQVSAKRMTPAMSKKSCLLISSAIDSCSPLTSSVRLHLATRSVSWKLVRTMALLIRSRLPLSPQHGCE